MNVLKVTLTVVALLTLGMTTYSCKGDSKAQDKTTLDVQQGKEYTSAYICPMHCDGSGSEKAGNCPVCGMAYEKNKDHKTDGHSHEGHDH